MLLQRAAEFRSARDRDCAPRINDRLGAVQWKGLLTEVTVKRVFAAWRRITIDDLSAFAAAPSMYR